MTNNKPIFDLRFGSNADICPAREELEVFLSAPKMEGRRETHGNDLVKYRDMLEGVKTFEQHTLHDTSPQDFQEKMFYGVLGQSYFFSPVLASAVEQYKYHVYTLLMLDFKKPTVFIASAKDAMSRLNPKKRDDAAKLARFRTMIDEREKTLEALERRQAALVGELGHIVLYLRDNLGRIEKHCETSIVVLVNLQLSRKKENQLIESIKTHFREHLRDSLRDGPVAKLYVETVKKDVVQLSKEISCMVRDDIYALTMLFEAVHGHVKKAVLEIDALMAKTERGKNHSIEDDRGLFVKIEKVLVSLVSEYHFELKPTILQSETAHQEILLEKRKELLDYVLELLEKERRSKPDRRTLADRRKFTAPIDTGPERRKGKDRRSGKKRR